MDDLNNQAEDIVERFVMEESVRDMVDLMATIYQEMIYQGFDESQAYDFTKEYSLNVIFGG